jgi:hypothetical protein
VCVTTFFDGVAEIARQAPSSLGEHRCRSVTWRSELAVVSYVSSTCAGIMSLSVCAVLNMVKTKDLISLSVFERMAQSSCT